jgi:hypothetical protein
VLKLVAPGAVALMYDIAAEVVMLLLAALAALCPTELVAFTVKV